MIKRIILALTAPIRYAVRYELYRKSALAETQDIQLARQRKALESTAAYVDKYMREVDSVDSSLSLLTKSLGKADVAGNKLICEFGVFSGITINHIAAHTTSTAYGFDSFEGLPERWRDGFAKGLFATSDLPTVRDNVVLVKGWFHQTLPEFLKKHNEDACFLHIDCDLYSSTVTVLRLLRDRIKPGCVIVFDEYFNYPGWEESEYKAFHEFLDDTGLGYDYLGYNRLHEQVSIQIKSR